MAFSPQVWILQKKTGRKFWELMSLAIPTWCKPVIHLWLKVMWDTLAAIFFCCISCFDAPLVQIKSSFTNSIWALPVTLDAYIRCRHPPSCFSFARKSISVSIFYLYTEDLKKESNSSSSSKWTKSLYRDYLNHIAKFCATVLHNFSNNIKCWKQILNFAITAEM